LVFWVATISSTVAAAIILQPNSLQVLYYHWSSTNTVSRTWLFMQSE
jgi:hypothetical protein